MKNKNESKIKNWCLSYYDLLMDLYELFKQSNNECRLKLIGDLFFLLVITCVIKIPFIFVRNLGDNIISIIFNSNITILAIWGLVLELIYAIVALVFFLKTLKKWLKQLPSR